jgi:hypothetical protein
MSKRPVELVDDTVCCVARFLPLRDIARLMRTQRAWRATLSRPRGLMAHWLVERIPLDAFWRTPLATHVTSVDIAHTGAFEVSHIFNATVQGHIARHMPWVRHLCVRSAFYHGAVLPCALSPGLETLRLGTSEFDAMTSFAPLRHLKSLVLEANVSLEFLSGLPQLESLTFNQPLDAAQTAHLCASTSLRHVNVHILRSAWVVLLFEPRAWTHLGLHGFGSGELPAATFLHLTSLDVSSADLLEAAPVLRQLHALHVRMLDANAVLLPLLASCVNLRQLTLAARARPICLPSGFVGTFVAPLTRLCSITFDCVQPASSLELMSHVDTLETLDMRRDMQSTFTDVLAHLRTLVAEQGAIHGPASARKRLRDEE